MESIEGPIRTTSLEEQLIPVKIWEGWSDQLHFFLMYLKEINKDVNKNVNITSLAL